ncbi:MAG: hypothetical protein K2M19_03510 [Muribaculaceae bacterium]|nr:hypothetical protein [Muribaculaceae bacterium]
MYREPPTPLPLADGRYLCRELHWNGRIFSPALLTLSKGKAEVEAFVREVHSTAYINSPLMLTTDPGGHIIYLEFFKPI